MIYWPRKLLIPRFVTLHPTTPTVSGAASLSGFRQAVAAPAAAWMVTFGGISVTTPAEELMRRSLAALINGRATPILIPVHERPELKAITLPGTGGTSTHDDDTTHDDGTGYATGVAAAIIVGAVALGAVVMTIRVISGPALVPGQHITIGLRLYRISTVEAVSGADQTVTFWPPARDDIGDGADVITDELALKVRLADDRGLAMAAERGRFGQITLGFIEDPS